MRPLFEIIPLKCTPISMDGAADEERLFASLLFPEIVDNGKVCRTECPMQEVAYLGVKRRAAQCAFEKLEVERFRRARAPRLTRSCPL
jgi:hypothetical protein